MIRDLTSGNQAPNMLTNLFAPIRYHPVDLIILSKFIYTLTHVYFGQNTILQKKGIDLNN